MIQKLCPLHKPRSTHLKNDLLYIFAFLKAWTMAYRWNRLWEASRPFWQGQHKYTTSNRHTWSLSWPTAVAQELLQGGDGASGKGTQHVVHVQLCFKLSGSALSTSYSLFSFTNSSDFGFYILLLLFCFSRRVRIFFFFFFKEHGCSKTERIRKWSGALSNALLKVHYKDE